MTQDLDKEFHAAFERANNLPKQPSDMDQLRLYAHYKQATVGDVSGKKPGMTQFRARMKYDAWARLKGTDADAAKRGYIRVVEELEQM